MNEHENTSATREQVIAAVIGARYSIDDQIALLRQKDTKPDEYAEFCTFAENAKKKVSAEFAAKAAAAAEAKNKAE